MALASNLQQLRVCRLHLGQLNKHFLGGGLSTSPVHYHHRILRILLAREVGEELVWVIQLAGDVVLSRLHAVFFCLGLFRLKSFLFLAYSAL